MADENVSESPDFADGVLKSMDAAVGEALNGDADVIRDKAREALQKLVDTVLGDLHDKTIEDPCTSGRADKNPTVGAACLARDLALKNDKRAEDKATATARSTLSAARDAWRAAKDDYEHNIQNAVTTLKSTLNAAVNVNTAKVNQDSKSRNQVLYFTLMSSAAAALQAYQGTAQAEGANLATAAGTLLTAYVAYVMAVEAARAQKMADDAAANQTFWTTIEGVLDAP